MLHVYLIVLNSVPVVYSALILSLMLTIAALIVILGCIRLYFLKHNTKAKHSSVVIGSPKVSIHLPVCSEPPELVIKTIKSIANLNYKNFELLVISNNTSDSDLWKPIEEKIHSLDSRFKFIHKEVISGYKAGALNLALTQTSPDARYIFTVDADYILHEEALDIAVGTIQKRNVQLLQFPQSYRNVSYETSGIEINYKHYFDCYLSSTSSNILALPTGTLTLIDVNVFKNGYLWPTDSITEDASLGVELVQKNMKLSFCNKVIGKGTMPTDSRDYQKQFERWVFGNFQVLAKVWKTRGISFGKKIHLSILLTAWVNFLGISFILMAAALPLLLLRVEYATAIYVTGILSVLLHCVFQVIIYSAIAQNNFKRAWDGFLVHMGHLEIGAFYWMHYFISKEKPFIRTNKFLSDSSISKRVYIFPIVLLGISCTNFVLQNHFIAILIGLFGFVMLLAKTHKDQEILHSKFNFYKQN